MSKLAPVSKELYIKFLESVGCSFKRQTDDHLVYDRPGLTRPIIFQDKKEVPIFHIKTNLRTLNITLPQFKTIIDKIKMKDL